MKTVQAWHFVNDTLRDGTSIPADGVWLEYNGRLELCASGLHASKAPWNALEYAPGATLCLVECAGEILEASDKLVCSRRLIVARMDFTEPLRYFARMQALSVVDKWEAPDVVMEYLMTGDDSIRGAAWDAARDAAWDAARDAAWDAARAAARAAARQDFNALVFECFEGPLASIARNPSTKNK